MRKAILLIALMGWFGGLYSQCTELFITEYLEGSNNNKALEIYNPTKDPIDLSKYRLTRWQNGSSVWNPQYSDTMNGFLCANCVYVVVLDKRNPAGTGIDTPVFAGLQAKADTFLSSNYDRSYSMYFNGDDALSLDKKVGNNWLPVDIFGKIGERPQRAGSSRTIGWSDSFPYNNGLGLWVTIDKTLIRKASVKQGVTVNPNYFKATAEWTVYPENTFDSLGTHICECNAYPASAEEIKRYQAQVFPNPLNEEDFTVVAPFAIAEVKVFQLTGQATAAKVSEVKEVQGMAMAKVSLAQVSSGLYIVKVFGANGETAEARIIRN